MQNKIKNLTIYVAVLLTILLAAYAYVEERPTLHARYARPTNLPALISHRQLVTDSLLKVHEDIRSELHYYLKVHRIDDEGYDMIADFNARNDSTILTLKARRAWGAMVLSPTAPAATTNLHVPIIMHRGYWYKGRWHRGTPPFRHGLLVSKDGIYKGMVDNHLQPSDHGVLKTADGSYFEGEWADGLQHGFGFHVRPFKDMQVGTWLNGRYKGERLHFTSERIYGIDISRYQHEIGRRRFRINWKVLRITDLGKHNQQNVTGEADYPVSFIYIKATQGTTVTNRYFDADYKAARACGYHVGAYHFYSTTTDAAEQAKHFLKTGKFNSGDFPPVFDVEPTDGQIKAMGGADKMLTEMRKWLSIVEKQLGIKPILYVNQGFVNKYLADAPDLKRGYLIWIARYSEYKPDVRLCWWQLSATGKVRGIEGNVDLNVFNGYQDQWEEFLANERIR